jgi:hypothetical protein
VYCICSADRQPLNDIIQVTFPYLQQLMTSILDNNSIEAAQVQRLCLKVFWSSTHNALPSVTGVDVNLWFQMMAHLLNKNLPEASENIEPYGQPISVDERNSWPWWKVSQSLFITYYIFR